MGSRIKIDLIAIFVLFFSANLLYVLASGFKTQIKFQPKNLKQIWWFQYQDCSMYNSIITQQQQQKLKKRE